MIYTKTCKHCGNEFQTGDNRQIFCSRSCGQRFRYDLHPVVNNSKRACPHNDAVECYVQKCNTCGWNPEVAKARTEAHEKKMKGE